MKKSSFLIALLFSSALVGCSDSTTSEANGHEHGAETHEHSESGHTHSHEGGETHSHSHDTPQGQEEFTLESDSLNPASDSAHHHHEEHEGHEH